MVKTPITEEWVENEHYQLVPHEDNEWQVRILEGDFTETVIRYGSVSFSEKDYTVKFDYSLVSSPDEYLDTENPDLQKTASKILHSILMGALDTKND